MSIRKTHNMRDMSLEEIADFYADSHNMPGRIPIAQAEFQFRIAEFEERATTASEKTANATIKYAQYTFWAVTFLAIAAIAQVIIALTN